MYVHCLIFINPAMNIIFLWYHILVKRLSLDTRALQGNDLDIVFRPRVPQLWHWPIKTPAISNAVNIVFLCYLFTQIDFRKYLMDNDSIVNEDLVAWVTIGAMHIPHSEDLPNTATAANSAHFFIRPFNYFDEDPSIGSTSAILITPKDAKFSGQNSNVERYGTPTGPHCVPKEYKFNFNGTYWSWLPLLKGRGYSGRNKNFNHIA